MGLEKFDVRNYKGKIVYSGEHNLAWDSYSYSIVWDEEERKFREIETGSTAGGYGCRDYGVDAPEWLISRWHRWMFVTGRWERRCMLIRHYCKGGLFYGDVDRLLRAYPDHYPTNHTLWACLKLLRTKKFRSPFRESLAKQLRDWIDGKSKYEFPFTQRQLNFLY